MNDPRHRVRSRTRIDKLSDQQLVYRTNWMWLCFSVIFWSIFFFVVTKVEPELIRDIIFVDLYAPFFVVLFLALWCSFQLIWNNWKRSTLYSASVCTLLILRIMDLAIIINTIALLLLVVAIELFYFSTPDREQNSQPDT